MKDPHPALRATFSRREKGVSLLLLALLCGCAAAPTPARRTPPPPPPEPRTIAAAARVILVSFDGLGADDVEAQRPAAITHLATDGTYARVVPMVPTVTSTTHATILTGADRDHTGVLSNLFHEAGAPAGQAMKGMDAEIKAPTLIDNARAAGKRVGSVLFPTVDAKSPRRTPDWGLVWTTHVVPARVVQLTKNDFHPEWVPPGWSRPRPRHTSFSPVMRTRIEQEIPKEGREELDLVAYDTTDDRLPNYDAFYVEHAGTETPLDAQRWFSVSTRFADGLYGSWSKLVSVDPALNSATLYLGAVNRNEGVPASYVRMIDDEAGFWPGAADDRLVDRRTYLEQIERLSSFLTRATTLSIRRMPFDLLLAYQPIVDATEHHLRGVDEPAVAYAIANADRAIATLSNAIDPARDALVVVGDHGVARIDTDVHINRILTNAGFAPRWSAYPSGNVVMLSRAGAPDDTAALIDLLQKLTTPDGSRVFEQVTHDAKRDDVTAFAFPRFVITAREGEPFTVSDVRGQHGGLTTHREYDTVLIGWGRGTARETLESLPQTAIANYVMRLLGIR
jgi:hypothetical protein